MLGQKDDQGLLALAGQVEGTLGRLAENKNFMNCLEVWLFGQGYDGGIVAVSLCFGCLFLKDGRLDFGYRSLGWREFGESKEDVEGCLRKCFEN